MNTPTDTLDSPIFVIGVERSGTTLLYSLLANHPDLYWLSRLDTVLPVVPRLTCTLRRIADRFQSGTVLAVPGAISRSRGVIPPSECQPYWRRYFGWGTEDDYRIADDRFDASQATPDIAARLRGDLAHRIQLSGRRRLLIKQTSMALKIPYIDAIFPRARFIHINRHPVSNIQSLVRAKEASTERFWGTKPPGWRDYLPASPMAQAIFQLDAILTTIATDVRALALSPERYLSIRYEDLTATPDTTMHTILDFCELAPTHKIEEALQGIRPGEQHGERAELALSPDESGVVQRLLEQYEKTARDE